MGVDEFGVIIWDTAEPEEEWLKRLDEEIAQYNSSNRYRLSLARGWSDLRRMDGTKKTLSDWKYEADCKMCENKGGVKRV